MTHSTSSLRQAVRALGIAILVASPFLGLPAAAAEPSSPPAIAQQAQPAAETTPTAKSATRSEVEGYAVREQASQALEKFQGGDTVVIVGGTTLAIIILVILVIVLI